MYFSLFSPLSTTTWQGYTIIINDRTAERRLPSQGPRRVTGCGLFFLPLGTQAWRLGSDEPGMPAGADVAGPASLAPWGFPGTSRSFSVMPTGASLFFSCKHVMGQSLVMVSSNDLRGSPELPATERGFKSRSPCRSAV